MSAAGTAMQTETARPKILFLDDHHVLLDALEFLASPHFEVKVADSTAGFEHLMETFSPDAAVLDIRMPDGDGFDVARRILAKRPDLKLVFLSMHTEPRFVKQAMDTGALAYVSKRAPADELLTAIRTVLNGGRYIGTGIQDGPEREQDPPLTERQIEVLRLISRGCSAKEIANQLNISVRTAEFHRAAIMERLRLHSTAMMTRYALEHGIV
jgi:two-component system nitrate/nitrite response regulator NarL